MKKGGLLLAGLEALVVQWLSKRSHKMQEVLSAKGKFGKREATVSLYPARYVDWLLAGVISELVLEVPPGFEVVSAQ